MKFGDDDTRIAAMAFGIVALVSLVLPNFVEVKPHFPQENLLGFLGWVALGSAIVAMGLAWCVGRITEQDDEGDA